MSKQKQIRKTVRHFNDPGHAHCLTFSCYQKRPLLIHDEIRLAFLEKLADVRTSQGYDFLAYVLMPNHVHLLVKPCREQYSIARFLHVIKSPTGFHALRFLRSTGASLPRFWQAGPGFDENVNNADRVRGLVEYLHNNPVRQGLVGSAVDWRWSSARFWAGCEEYDLALDSFG